MVACPDFLVLQEIGASPLLGARSTSPQETFAVRCRIRFDGATPCDDSVGQDEVVGLLYALLRTRSELKGQSESIEDVDWVTWRVGPPVRPARLEVRS